MVLCSRTSCIGTLVLAPSFTEIASSSSCCSRVDVVGNLEAHIPALVIIAVEVVRSVHSVLLGQESVVLAIWFSIGHQDLKFSDSNINLLVDVPIVLLLLCHALLSDLGLFNHFPNHVRLGATVFLCVVADHSSLVRRHVHSYLLLK